MGTIWVPDVLIHFAKLFGGNAGLFGFLVCSQLYLREKCE